MILPVKYLHGLDYGHQDIPLSTIILNGDSRIILADFRIRHFFVRAVFVAGSLAYQASEMLDTAYCCESAKIEL
jgi:hypothetical protein